MRSEVHDWLDPDYTAIWRERRWLIDQIRRKGDEGVAGARAFYRENPMDAIEDLATTIDPRKANPDKRVSPFIFTPRQRELFGWLQDRFDRREFGCIAKSREIGASWVCLYFAWTLWEFFPNTHITFGSQIARKVDQIGDLNALLPKLRFAIRALPVEFRPKGWDEEVHAPLNRLRHTTNGSQIVGEAGDGIGRGGRASIAFVDEAAFLEHPEKVDASLSETSDCVIYLSTANGTGNPFHRKVMGGDYKVFWFRWQEDPRKNQAWYERKKKDLEPEILASEVDLDFEASNENSVMRAEWLRSCQELRKYLEERDELPLSNELAIAGLDVADGGGAKSVFVPRRGPLIGEPTAWTTLDVIDTADEARRLAIDAGILTIHFDSVGVGAGTAARFRRLTDVVAIPINVGRKTTLKPWPDGKNAKEKFTNLKAECWWTMRDRVWRTHLHWLWIQNPVDGVKIADLADLILLPDHKHLVNELAIVRYNKTEGGKIQIESKKQLANRGVKSPDYAEAAILTVAPRPVGVQSGNTSGLS